ncbi:MAG: hypothetical protein ACRDX8_13010, partial [Acidimicrobiales bacterium]
TAQLITAALASIYTTPPNGTVTIRVQGFLRSRTVPPVTDSAGNPLTQLPVGVAGGKASTQYWNRQVFTVGSGQQTIQSKRVGNVIRKLIFILRQTVTGARDSADWFTLARWLINNTPERVMVPAKWLFDMKSDYGYAAAIDTPGGLDTGVFVLEYQDQLGHPDPSELRDYYLPTRSSTLLQIDGVLGSGVSSYNLELLTNDISPTAGAPISTAGA